MYDVLCSMYLVLCKMYLLRYDALCTSTMCRCMYYVHSTSYDVHRTMYYVRVHRRAILSTSTCMYIVHRTSYIVHHSQREGGHRAREAAHTVDTASTLEPYSSTALHTCIVGLGLPVCSSSQCKILRSFPSVCVRIPVRGREAAGHICTHMYDVCVYIPV